MDEEQKSRAFLKETFLRFININLQGKSCSITTKGNTDITCKIVAFEPKMENILVVDLTTPTSEYIKNAILRSEDIVKIDFIL